MSTMSNSGTNTEEPDMQDTSFFTELAAAITGAKQTANQEFGRFWEKFVSTKDGKSSNTVGTTTRLTPSDLSHMKARKNIQGRIIPDNKFSVENSHHQHQYRKRPAPESPLRTSANKISKMDLLSPFSSYSPPSTPVHRQPVTRVGSSQSVHTSPHLTAYDLTPPLPPPPPPPQPAAAKVISSPIRNPVAQSSPIAERTPINFSRTPLAIRPIRSPSVRRSIASSTPSSIRGSPERPDIVTGSSKSVKRLACELEEALSPRFTPISYSPLRKDTTGSNSNSISTPAATSVAATATDVTVSPTKSIRKAVVDEDPFDSKPLTGLRRTVQRWTTEEEEERIHQLKNRIHSMQSQINEEIALPSMPSHKIQRESKVRSPSPPPPRQKERFRVPVAPPAPVHPLPRTPSSVPMKDTTQMSDEKPSPTEKHKLKMRQLIQAIPFYQLRKADKIIGADGVERPNPFWTEIYGKRSR
ncbi:uncharacterized protein EV154DRAFT_505889 [Mucor mucedo]|uniref:uncharacterized protein n=1 Tax=Mucor mucedo TaxID=29922 RepID=UPI00221EEC48|nr:uncharacterized protein EV154DRAFT_505889 [Mucor mucedo]KAI7892179.1 hypothetical protein EV154DRAFT_505889 [Mucor mucedo]